MNKRINDLKQIFAVTKKTIKVKMNDQANAIDYSLVNVGDTVIPERKIKYIIKKSDEAVVFFDSKDDIDYMYFPEKINLQVDSIISDFERLKTIIKNTYKKDLKNELLVLLGEKLHEALTSKKASYNPFFIVESKIKKTPSFDEKRSKFVALTIFYTLLFSFILLICYFSLLFIINSPENLTFSSKILHFFAEKLNPYQNEIKTLFCCLIGGCYGACFSVSYRKDINLPRQVNFFNPQIIVRCVYGMLSGVIIFSIIKAKLFMGFIGDNNANKAANFQFFTLSFISGFSERLIPSMLSKIERETIMEEKDKKRKE
jgi:uncharacterized protein with PQ loop repeat